MSMKGDRGDAEQLTKRLSKSLDEADVASVQETLVTIRSLSFSNSVLSSSSITRVVGKLRKHTDAKVQSISSGIVKSWKFQLANVAAPSSSSKSHVDDQPVLSVQKYDLATALASPVNLKAASVTRGPNWQHYSEKRPDFRRRVRVRFKSKASKQDGEDDDVGEESSRPVVYWMSRDQRLHDNWALLYAQKLAVDQGRPLTIVFNLVTGPYLGATQRAYGFMLRSLKVLAATAQHTYNISFVLLLGEPGKTIPEFLKSCGAVALVADVAPIRIVEQWKLDVVAALEEQSMSKEGNQCRLFAEVDAHNVSPVWETSSKCEFAARTIRPKIHKAMAQFLVDFPALRQHPHGQATNSYYSASSSSSSSSSSTVFTNAPLDWSAALRELSIDDSVREVDWCVPGEVGAAEAFRRFQRTRLSIYQEERNDPTKRGGTSCLSPYLHFGHLSAQRIALEIVKLTQLHLGKNDQSEGTREAAVSALFPAKERVTSAQCFLEELVVRRELSDNFCFYNPNYDTIDGAHDWAKTTIAEHAADNRPIIYTRKQLESAATSDGLWNAAQREMMARGKMHGFLRMYWAKKILEWSPSAAEALQIAIYLNDKYELDGRDPNGYVGCLWAIGGVHDRAWGPERPIFGKIRYMNYDGCKRKFSIPSYVAMNPRASK